MMQEGQQESIPADSLHSELFDRPTYEHTRDLARRYVAANAVIKEQSAKIAELESRLATANNYIAALKQELGKEEYPARDSAGDEEC